MTDKQDISIISDKEVECAIKFLIHNMRRIDKEQTIHFCADYGRYQQTIETISNLEEDILRYKRRAKQMQSMFIYYANKWSESLDEKFIQLIKEEDGEPS